MRRADDRRAPRPHWRALGAEFMGSLLFVFAAAASFVSAHFLGSASGGLLTIALTQGLALAALTFATAPLSGAHLNPAVTLGAWSMGRLETLDTLGYLAAQLAGGLGGALFARALLPIESVAATAIGSPVLGPGTPAGRAFALELLLATVVVAAVLGATLRTRSATRTDATATALAAGTAYTVAVLVTAPLTGAALNPARVLGTALVSGHTTHLWLYLAAPLLGGLLAATALRLMAAPDDDDDAQR